MKVSKVIGVVVGIILIITYIIGISEDTLNIMSANIVFQDSPEFIQGEINILDNETKNWLENHIKSKSKESGVAVVMECHRVKYNISEEYINNVLFRVIKNAYNSQKYVVMIYFDDVKELVIFTNIEQNEITSKTIEGVNTIEELSKEVGYIILNLTEDMKPVRFDFTKEYISYLIWLYIVSSFVFLIGGINNIVLALKKK